MFEKKLAERKSETKKLEMDFKTGTIIYKIAD